MGCWRIKSISSLSQLGTVLYATTVTCLPICVHGYTTGLAVVDLRSGIANVVIRSGFEESQALPRKLQLMFY